MLEHVVFKVANLPAAKHFYTSVLRPLGYHIVKEVEGVRVGYSDKAPARFWIWKNDTDEKQKVHLAFQAKSRADVDAFYKAAIEAGGKDNGPPGVRPQYSPDYYGAFVLDLDGNNIEACHRNH